MKKLELSKSLRKFFTVAFALMVVMVGSTFTTPANASVSPPPSFSSVEIRADETTDGDALMGGIIGWLLSIVRYVGIGILVWGIVEIILSITQDMPDKKIKGITLAFSGVACIALKSILAALGIIS